VPYFLYSTLHFVLDVRNGFCFVSQHNVIVSRPNTVRTGETKQFQNCFETVSVLFQVHFNCADSLSVRVVWCRPARRPSGDVPSPTTERWK